MWWLVLGCAEQVGDTDAVVVVFSIDTLGQTMANQTGWCERVSAIMAEHGLDLACLSGAVTPSSWTGEAHTRMLWPENTTGSARKNQYPECGQPSVMETIRDSTGGTYIFGADNSVLSASGKESCELFRSVYTQGSDEMWETHMAATNLALVAEEDRPVAQAIEAFGRWLPQEERSVTLFLNTLEPGGHEPRCWQDPGTDACVELWEIAVNAGLASAGDDPVDKWLESEFYEHLLHYASVKKATEEDRWRPLFWQTATETVEDFRAEKFDQRLCELLDLLGEHDRLDDLRLVAFGDHGENPCMLRGLGDDTLNCGHNGITTEYTGFVPVYVSPASLAAGWQEAGLSTDAGPWSTMNLAHGLVDSVSVPRPAAWPEPWPVGTAPSWTCQSPGNSSASGIFVEGEVAMRCREGNCDASGFVLPADHLYRPSEASEVSASVAAYGEAPDWFSVACGVD